MSDRAATELGAWDAVECTARLRRGDVSARELVDAALARAADVAHLGAVVVMTPDRARAAAGREAGGLLRGVPTFLKDLVQQEGVPTAWGSAGSVAFVSQKSDPFVARLERAGLVSLGKSATPEFGLIPTTEPLGRTPCQNPWAPSHSSGGSSGGAACLVATGVVPMAHASDGGGSIRIPAACCGLVGLKPTRGLIDMEASHLLPVNIATHGAVTRTVRDSRLFYEALEAEADARGAAPTVRIPPPRTGPLRIGVYVDAPLGLPVDAEVQAATLAAAETCRTLGHQVDAIPCPFEGQELDDFLAFWAFIAWVQVVGAPVLVHRGFDTRRVEPWTKGLGRVFVERKGEVFAAMRRLRGFAARHDRVMERFDVLISPTLGHAAPVLGHLAGDVEYGTLRERLRTYCGFTPLQNASGTPAISLPLGRTEKGLPIGVQLAGDRFADRTLLALAERIEEATPWPLVAPRERWVGGRRPGGVPPVRGVPTARSSPRCRR